MKLKPIRHVNGRKVYWVVRVGKQQSATGKARKHYFPQRNDANKFITQLTEARQRLGESAYTLSLEQQGEAVRAFGRLQPLGLSLTTVVDEFLRTNALGRPCPKLSDFADEFLAARKKTCTAHTLANYRSELKPALKEFGRLPLNQIRQSDVEEWSVELEFAPRTCVNILDTLTTVFNDAVRKEHLARNPALHVPRPKLANVAPGILTPVQAERLLTTAQQLRPELMPALAIALFAGLRRSEICRLNRSHLLLDEGLIEVPSSAAKTRQRRLVTIRENLKLWLARLPADDLPLALTTNPDVFGSWVHDLAIQAGILNWPHNAMRHSFASYLYALTRNEGTVAAEMGNTPNVVIRHYRAVVRPAAATTYFQIVPAGSAPVPTGGKTA